MKPMPMGNSCSGWSLVASGKGGDWLLLAVDGRTWGLSSRVLCLLIMIIKRGGVSEMK